MTGFRRRVPTQDTVLRLREVFDQKSTPQTRVVAGEDIQKAFDNVAHSAILDRLALTKPGERMFNYIKDFLTNRTKAIQMGDYISPKQKLQAGVPQGVILSPTLFILALKDLRDQLERTLGLKSALYADDIILW
ncbi:hypothetical protein HPB47_026377 [Ixodes persulcatus]|uniref:Uncharacterized protein n=1 Tax=Ixodes persulcatus TaxID=34615 RepID=A0AC60PYX3_IXOPE|nr:hypothetical protein HPB47_026377 [Ixodes persulcatus]